MRKNDAELRSKFPIWDEDLSQTKWIFDHNGSEADMDGLTDLNISVKMHGIHGMGAAALSM